MNRCVHASRVDGWDRCAPAGLVDGWWRWGAAMTDSYPGKVDTTRLPEGHEGVGVKKSPPEGDEGEGDKVTPRRR